ncbi:3-demethylubiquinone-9 3-methyltransferase [Listeria fleischmannii 1991]|uniref:3-demethylubiquinone-9 3-methyltransferase n=3 Tax=Listeria fleischmannii TaxID=1069827 RepID=A0A2X3GEH7_9LIST|nr:VOC family protein [Listeria fleischmannii]EMG27836.1 methyltransferase [Listeria fleischmannii subsp. fleischmannii LU2006-1]KMT58561.1 3-demethylubiquinone-9 3-methyltransferase [Listeria fleischmannii 1991]MBC1417731.1 VOC family protein [Listeria fleischmannii]SQC66418.1 3-demethylubiquinone-9 3-methyltransferase [Listeria fleischmannii subsp. fleischmannii]
MLDQNQISTFLTFSGQAEEAVKFYVDLFDEGKIISTRYFEEGEPGEVGKIYTMVFELGNQKFAALDMEKKYAVDFSWATSIFVETKNEAEFDRLFEAFKEGGHVMMGPEAMGIYSKVTWVTDRFGVTWQLVCEK